MAAYVIAIIDIKDVLRYDREYVPGVLPLIEKHGGRPLVVTDTVDIKEGPWPQGRTIVLEFPTEAAAYDRLALSVTGDTLTEVYLEHRRAVRMEERGGARARVEAVEVVEVSSVGPGDAGGFVAGAVWTVGGTVTHFGHRHFRQNRYDARVAVVPVDGHWKIQSIEVLDEKRLR